MPGYRWPATLLVFSIIFTLAAPGIAGQIDGESWTSPTYGFRVSWAGTNWTPSPTGTLTGVGPERLDRIHLVNGISSLYFEGATRYEGDLSACVGTEANLLAQEAGVSGIRPYRDARGTPLTTSEEDVEAAAFTLSLVVGPDVLELVDYVECRTLIPGEAVMVVTLVTEPRFFLDELRSAKTVIDSITFEEEEPVDPIVAYGAWVATAERQASAAGPLAGELRFGPGSLATERAGIDAVDFYARASFSSPGSDLDSWDFGFGFRDRGGEEQLRLVVDSAGNWFFKDGLGDVIASGKTDRIDSGAKGENELEVVAVGDTGYFALNEQFVSALDLSSRDTGGDVFVGAGFFQEDAQREGIAQFSDFEIWRLSEGQRELSALPAISLDPKRLNEIVALAATGNPLADPLAGELVQTVGAAAVQPAGVDVVDFIASATFFNPEAAPDRDWDFGIAFREQGDGTHYRLTLDSDGTWEFQIGVQPDLASGGLPTFNREAGAANTLEIVVAGDTAAFLLNGAFVSLLDVSELQSASDVWIGAGFHEANVVAGSVTPFADFTVWPVDLAALEAEAPSAPIATPASINLTGEMDVAVDLLERDNSGVDGIAVLSGNDETTTISIAGRGATGDEVVVIHRGTCEAMSAMPAYLLTDLDEAGNSETTIQAPLEEISNGSMSIAIHRSAAEYEEGVACGSIPPAA